MGIEKVDPQVGLLPNYKKYIINKYNMYGSRDRFGS